MTNINTKNKKSSGKLTPCRAIKLLFFSNKSSLLVKETTNELLSLVKIRNDDEGNDFYDDSDDDANHNHHHRRSTFLRSERIFRLLQENPSIANSIDPMNGYNALHYLCANPTLLLATRNSVTMMIVEALIRASSSLEKQQKQHPPKHHDNDSKESSSRMIIEHKDEKCTDEDVKTSAAPPILRQQTLVNGYLPLHVLCQNASSLISSSSFDVLELVLKSYPDAVFFPDQIHLNLPLHEICQACTEHPISIQLVRLLIQAWPQSCHVRNGDGNLPLHLASNIMLTKDQGEFSNDDDHNDKVRFQNQFQIVQYLLDIYPEGLIIQNHQGLTPLQIAILSSNDMIHDHRLGKGSFNDCHSGDQNNNNKGNSHSNRYHHPSYYQPIIKLLQNDTSCSDTASLSTTENESLSSIRNSNKKMMMTMSSPPITKSRSHDNTSNGRTNQQTYVTTKSYPEKNNGEHAAHQTNRCSVIVNTGVGKTGRRVVDDDDKDDDYDGRRRYEENDEESNDNHDNHADSSPTSTPSSFIIDDDHYHDIGDDPLVVRRRSSFGLHRISGRALDDWETDITKPWMMTYRHNEIASSSSLSRDQPIPRRDIIIANDRDAGKVKTASPRQSGSNLLRIRDHHHNKSRRHGGGGGGGDLGIVGSSPRLDVISSRHNVEYYCPFPTWSQTANQLSNGISKIDRNVNHHHHHKQEDTSRYSITLAVEALEQFEDGYDKVDSDKAEKVYVEEEGSDRKLLLQLSPIMQNQYAINKLDTTTTTTTRTTGRMTPSQLPPLMCTRSSTKVKRRTIVKRRGSWLTMRNDNNVTSIDLDHHVGEC